MTQAGGPFDIIVIDGRHRVLCARYALEALKPDGIIVWDNTDRDRYREGYAYLESQGFQRRDFDGMGPINNFAWRTSIFYRPGNFLGR